MVLSNACRLLNVQLGETSRLAWLGVEVDPQAHSNDMLKACNKQSEPAAWPSSNLFTLNDAVFSGLGFLGIKQGQGDSVAEKEATPPKARRKRLVRRKVTTSSV